MQFKKIQDKVGSVQKYAELNSKHIEYIDTEEGDIKEDEAEELDLITEKT